MKLGLKADQVLWLSSGKLQVEDLHVCLTMMLAVILVT